MTRNDRLAVLSLIVNRIHNSAEAVAGSADRDLDPAEVRSLLAALAVHVARYDLDGRGHAAPIAQRAAADNAARYLDPDRYPHSLRFRIDPDGAMVCPVQSEVENIALATLQDHHTIYTEPIPLPGPIGRDDPRPVGRAAFLVWDGARMGWTVARAAD